MNNPFIVSADWLFANLDLPDISIVDGSWYLPNMTANGIPRNGKREFEEQHIPGAVYFDIDDVVEPDSGLPHTLASPEIFARKAGALGIAETDTIVVYDGMGLFSAPRVWWNFRIMGATKVVLLDGGLPRWIENRLPIESGHAPIYPKLFKPNLDESQIVSLEEMQSIVDSGARQILDARPAGRFTGEEAEPRPGVRSGHMPGALSTPFSDLAENGSLKSAEELRQFFAERNVDLDKPVTTSCGSGVTAAALILALETIGHHDHSLYDGSWSEWGSRKDTPVVTGEA